MASTLCGSEAANTAEKKRASSFVQRLSSRCCGGCRPATAAVESSCTAFATVASALVSWDRQKRLASLGGPGRSPPSKEEQPHAALRAIRLLHSAAAAAGNRAAHRIEEQKLRQLQKKRMRSPCSGCPLLYTALALRLQAERSQKPSVLLYFMCKLQEENYFSRGHAVVVCCICPRESLVPTQPPSGG